jgi:hypothetical protein
MRAGGTSRAGQGAAAGCRCRAGTPFAEREARPLPRRVTPINPAFWTERDIMTQPHPRTSLQLLFLCAAVTGLSACGGGGGGSAASPSAAPAPGPAPAPAPTSSGLAAPTAHIQQSDGSAIQLAVKVADVYNKAPGGAAAVAIGGARPVVGQSTVNCSGGGNVAYSGPASGATATYNACVIGPYTFGGSATVSYVANGSTVQSYTIDYTSLTASATGGFSSTLTGRTSCDSASGAMLCVADYRSIRWGNNFAFDFGNALANGDTACECNATEIVDVTAANLGATSGAASVTGASGSAQVTRTSATAFTVDLTAQGSTMSNPVTGVTPPP